jgi:calcineurin-like phosphoesterase family protein
MVRIKKNRKDYHNIKFCSDLHFGHDKDFVYAKRGFNSAREHALWLIDQLETLHSDDLLVVLGDVGLSIGPDSIAELVRSFKCETLMVWGNHNSGVKQLYDAALPDEYKSCEIYPLRITHNVTMLGDSAMLQVDSRRYYLTHMCPLVWPELGRGAVTLCGHSHGSLKGINAHHSVHDIYGPILDCGIENTLSYNKSAFFTVEEVDTILSGRKKAAIDHH